MKDKSNKEFVPDYFLWLNPDKQKERAKELEKITKKREKRKN